MSLSGRDFESTLRAPHRIASPHRARSIEPVTTTTLMPASANGAMSFSPLAEHAEVEVEERRSSGAAA